MCVRRTASWRAACGRRSACATEILVCYSFVESRVHALRLRSQKILCSQSRERLLFNRCSLLLFSFGCPTMLNTCAVGPTLYVSFLDGYVCIEVLCTLVILAVVETCD